MKKFVAILLCLVMVLAVVACKKTDTKTETPADTKTETTEAKKLQVVNLVNGNLGDKSFFDSAESGMKALADAGLVEYKTIEMGTDESTWQNYVEEVAASKKYDIIVCGTWQMPDNLIPVAQKYTDQLFIIYDTEVKVDDKYLPNIASIQYNQNDMGYLVGVYAALLETKSDLSGLNEQKILGFVGGEDSPVICDFLVGYIEGAQSIGADIIWGVGGNAGTGAVEACYEKGMYFIGVDSDQEQTLDPKYAAVTLTSGLKNVGTSLEYVIKKYLEGDKSFWGTCTYLGLAEDGVGIATAGNFAKQSQEIQDAVNAVKDKILKGEVKVDTAFDANFDYYGLMNAVKSGN